jgi:calcineurin-like phosphoesterase family protein
LDAKGDWISPQVAFERAEKMNADLTRDANMRVKPDDMAICVGDFSCRGGEKGTKGVHAAPAEILSKLNGTWVIIGGNHDDNNGVKPVGEFMAVEIAKYRVGVQHRPLVDEEIYRRWESLPAAEKEKSSWSRMSAWSRDRTFAHAEYCRRMFDFMLVGHVHNAWTVRKIAGLWHVNVGVDANRYMPINDTEVALVVEKAVRGERQR